MSDDTTITTPQITLEYFPEDGAQALVELVNAGSAPVSLLALLGAIASRIPEEYRAQTRVVYTADFVRSVNDRRTDSSTEEYTRERGSGIVAGKTMGKQPDGLVDILFPADWITIEQTDEFLAMLRHLGAHEAVHATIHHIGAEPFDVHRREKFGYASLNFVSMAGEQIEEHLAEYLANQVQFGTTGQGGSSVDQVKETFDAWQDTLAVQLPAIPEDDPDYFQKGMFVTFNALHILWKTLAYLAAEIRDGDDFRPVPDEIVTLPEWRQVVAPWWGDYTALLAEVPMTMEQDIPATDEVVKRMGLLLQRWALGVGFDFHDDEQGGGFFRITLWD